MGNWNEIGETLFLLDDPFGLHVDYYQRIQLLTHLLNGGKIVTMYQITSLEFGDILNCVEASVRRAKKNGFII